MNVAVIGARGFVGARVVRQLEGLVDLVGPEDADVVVDAAGIAPAEVRRHVARGAAVIDCSADAARVRELLAGPLDGPGALVVGAGVFPGVSNLVAARDRARAVLVELDPLSGAGSGTIDSLTGALFGPGVRCERVELAGGVRVRALAIDSADAAIAAALGPRPLQLLITTRQRWMAAMFPLLAWIGRRRWLGRAMARLANLGMKLVRGRLLRRRPTALALYTVGDRGPATRVYASADGFTALARAIAWAALQAGRAAGLRGAVSFTGLFQREQLTEPSLAAQRPHGVRAQRTSS